MGRTSYPPELRQKALHLLDSGLKVSEVSRELGVNQQTVYSWRRQARSIRNRALSVRALEAQWELVVAKRRIAQLEAELDVYRSIFGFLKEAVPRAEA